MSGHGDETEPMSGRAPTGIVLAGGRSTRFGADKLAVEVDGEPLLWRPIRALAVAGCGTIVVAIGPDRAAPALPPDLVRVVRVAHDREPDGGPLVGLRAGLAAAPSGIAVVVAGDQPSLRPALLRSLVQAMGESLEGGHPGGRAPLAVVLVDPAGIARPLPCAVDRDAALAAADRLLAGRDTSLRALVRALDAQEIPEPLWRRHDPDAAWTMDVDEPADLPPPVADRPADDGP
jgi:molybdopterin-guanine dinucleotide biosynthesis protein A